MKLKFNSDEYPKRRLSAPLEEISSKSQVIKAGLKVRYMIHRLERSFFSRQVL